jgi:uncharacterized protein (TIGR00303 family)
VSNLFSPMVGIDSNEGGGRSWLMAAGGKLPIFGCVLGFTDTCLIPGISAAGKTPEDRRYTAIADAEFLANGWQPSPRYPLPPLIAGASPVYITRSIVAGLDLPVYIFNAGLPISPSVPHIDLDGAPAACLTTAKSLPLVVVERLFQQGLLWGEKLASTHEHSYLVLGECVVGGTTTALSVLTGLGIDAAGKVNSSHPTCNHAQKAEIVRQGCMQLQLPTDPLAVVAAVGDPMQIVVAGMAIAASRTQQVLLAGGTQMLAVYALARSIAQSRQIEWQPEHIAIGTTRWVATDPSGDTVALAKLVGDVPLITTQLSFSNSHYPQLQSYERGFVKEGVGAGGMAIAASLYAGWGQIELLAVVEKLLGEGSGEWGVDRG